MPKLKKKLTGNFTIINNTVLRDKRMGCTERGAYVTLVSMADDWNFSIRGLAAIMPDGVTKISGALKRLEALGYLRRERLYENGKIKDWVYYIYDEPCACDTADDTDVENSDFFDSQDTDFSDTENLDTENQYQASEHLQKPHDYNPIIAAQSTFAHAKVFFLQAQQMARKKFFPLIQLKNVESPPISAPL